MIYVFVTLCCYKIWRLFPKQCRSNNPRQFSFCECLYKIQMCRLAGMTFQLQSPKQLAFCECFYEIPTYTLTGNDLNDFLNSQPTTCFFMSASIKAAYRLRRWQTLLNKNVNISGYERKIPTVFLIRSQLHSIHWMSSVIFFNILTEVNARTPLNLR